MIKKYLKENILITDGAMGTYYSQLTGNDSSLSEFANIDNPDLIKKIHTEYIEAGASLIRTNTFSANTFSLNVSYSKIAEIIERGCEIAKETASKFENIFVAADIGPIPDVDYENNPIDKKTILEEYYYIIDQFIKNSSKIFLFETFGCTENITEITKYIKNKVENAYIIVQFSILPDGYTRKGFSTDQIIKEINKIKEVDTYGFNCGTGPRHMYNNLKHIDFSEKPITILPNAGFPEVVNHRTVYSTNGTYFAKVINDFTALGAKVVGGCCGTTPVHIQKIAEQVKSHKQVTPITKATKKLPNIPITKIENKFFDKLQKGDFVIACELDPPFDFDISKVINGAKVLKESNIDIITLADSPLGRVRLNPIALAARVKREIGIDVLPHLACRDRNMIALKSDIMAAYSENIRNFLLVTGDPIPAAEKNEIKSVFNLNSINFTKFLSTLNNDLFKKDPVKIGGALNLNALNKDAQITRMEKKLEAGASFFLTQPIYDDETIDYLINLKRKNNVKILGGLMPLVSRRNAEFLSNELPGIIIPQKYVKKFDEKMSREEAEEIGIDLTIEIAKQIKPVVDGFYFIAPFNRASMINKVVEKL